MTAWRKKGIKLFPDLEKEIRNNKLNIYSLFTELKIRLEDAYKINDIKNISKIYNFAEWCLDNKLEHVSNAAGVSFYEDIVKDKIILKSIPYWIKPLLFKKVKGLFEIGFGKNSKRYEELLRTYNLIHKTKFRKERFH